MGSLSPDPPWAAISGWGIGRRARKAQGKIVAALRFGASGGRLLAMRIRDRDRL
jgi:hypothetical protein